MGCLGGIVIENVFDLRCHCVLAIAAVTTNSKFGKLTRKLIDQIKTDKLKQSEECESHKLETFLELFNPNLAALGKPEKFDGTFEKNDDGELIIGIANKYLLLIM